jgi:hypothetical protein
MECNPLGIALHAAEEVSMSKPISRAEQVERRRAKLRVAGPRPIQIWVPDTRAPGFGEECRRQSRLIRESETDAHSAEDEAWEAASWEAVSATPATGATTPLWPHG